MTSTLAASDVYHRIFEKIGKVIRGQGPALRKSLAAVAREGACRTVVCLMFATTFANSGSLAAAGNLNSDWWSLRPLTRPVVPKSGRLAPNANPIDAFILAKL